MSTIGLVGCCRRKLAEAAPALELYTSPLFRLASLYCTLSCHAWFILSARHGLVDPQQVLVPYDVTLHELGPAGRVAWALQVQEQLGKRGLLNAGHRFVLHAGRVYAEPLLPYLEAEQPLRGLAIGQRLAWYRRQLMTITFQGDSHERSAARAGPGGPAG